MRRRFASLSWPSLLPLVAGLLLFAAGWSSTPNRLVPEPPSQLAVSPGALKLTVLKGSAPEALAERWNLDGPLSLELSRADWPKKTLRVQSDPGVTAIRLPTPRATLSVTVAGDESSEVEFLTLPAKKTLPSAQGQARLEAGAHELLLSAKGYLPQRLSVNLRPAERKKVTVRLEAIPSLPRASALPSLPSASSLPRRPSAPPSSDWSPPPVSAPPAWYPPRSPSSPPSTSAPARAPAPRFTPVPSAPRVGTPNPQPMFTPISP